MAALRDEDGAPVRLQLRFWPRADLEDASGKVDLALTTSLEPCATVDVQPEVFLSAALDDLGFAIARRRPEHAGATLPVGVRFAPGPEPSAPTLVAKDPAEVARLSWPEAAAVWRQIVPLCSLDVSRVVSHLRRRNVAPGDLNFAVAPVPLRPAGGPRRLLAPVEATGLEAAPWLQVSVPCFPVGEAPAEVWMELDEERAAEADVPVYLPIQLLDELVAGEAAYGEASGESWVERCWFLAGDLVRAGGDVTAVVRRILPAREVEASASDLSFSPATWVALREALDREGERSLGWVHTHSLSALTRLSEELSRKEGPAATAAAEAAEVPEPAAGDGKQETVSSGLFLSARDVESAERRGFRAPWSVTAVLDADACRRRAQGEAVPVRELLAAWGWFSGILARRSLRLGAFGRRAVKEPVAPAHPRGVGGETAGEVAR